MVEVTCGHKMLQLCQYEANECRPKPPGALLKVTGGGATVSFYPERYSS